MELIQRGENADLKAFNKMISYITSTPFCITRMSSINPVIDKYNKTLK